MGDVITFERIKLLLKPNQIFKWEDWLQRIDVVVIVRALPLELQKSEKCAILKI